MMMKSGWDSLGVVETIYEEELDEDYLSSSSPSFSPSISSPPTPLPSRVEAWSSTTGQKTDALVYVQDSSFHLHKDRLTRSGYLKRQLTDTSVVTLSPPLKITPETFTLVAEFCYGALPVITPFNIAALITASELLEMTEVDDNGNGNGNLRQVTEAYFRRVVSINREHASTVFRSCLSLLPEAETTAFLMSRCIDALRLTDGNGTLSFIEEIKTVGVEDFLLVVDSMYRRFTGSHDVLYRIVDFYIKENGSKMTEGHKTQLCNSIDCTNISPQTLKHAVQNPRMPLRFIVRAMFAEQLNTRHSIIAATANNHRRGIVHPQDHHRQFLQTPDHHHHHPRRRSKNEPTTLGAILQRDAALRQVMQLKEAMEATYNRIQTLEEDLKGMRKVLRDSEKKQNEFEFENEKILTGSGQSASFRLSSSSSNKIERGERGSVSSASLRFRGQKSGEFSCSSNEVSSCKDSPGNEMKFGRRLMKGLKSAFRVSALAPKDGNNSSISSKAGHGGDESEDRKQSDYKKEEDFPVKDGANSYRRRRSALYK